MAVPSALRDRFTRWCDELDAYGYEFAAPKRTARSGGEFVIGARRPTTYGGPAVVIEIKELWSPGGDPHGLGLELHGCFLHRGSWHAQFFSTGAVGAERLDVDRRKESALIIHRHPLGQPNDKRVPAAPLASPERWLEEVETCVDGVY